MPRKRYLTESEKVGLTAEEVSLANKWLRQHGTAGCVGTYESVKLFELYLMGQSLQQIQAAYPQYTLGQLALTCAQRKWYYERIRMSSTLQERVRARVIKSVLDQVDLLTAMLSVASVEHQQQMEAYIKDPKTAPLPEFRIKSIKDYQAVADTLHKIVVAAADPSGTSKRKTGSVYDNLLSAPLEEQQKVKQLSNDNNKELSILDVEFTEEENE
jgi:hypothetical protein